MDKKPVYITTTLPYVNAEPHIGFAMEIVRADALARFFRNEGHDVFFNTGTDEHGTKIYEKARELGEDTQTFTDRLAERFLDLTRELGISNDAFIRTTNEHHKHSAQTFWKLVDSNGYIYKKKYKGLYCVGCELFVTEKDLVDGKCPHHPTKKPEILEEENYFFKFSAFQDALEKYYAVNKTFVTPDFRFNEIKAFLGRGLEDFSISRSKERMPWGVPVPGDDTQVMYVWFDALVNYISTLGWPEDTEGKYKTFWENGVTIQYAGKDNLRQQSAMWQAMLLSAGIPCTNNIIINGFIMSDGQKMSKSLGNVIDPFEIVSEYGRDALRAFLLLELSSFEDSDFTIERFKSAYNANMANGIGNLSSRIMKLAEKHISPVKKLDSELPSDYREAFEEYNLQRSAQIAWHYIRDLDRYIQETEPFKVIKEDEARGIELIAETVVRLGKIAYMLMPFIPDTSEKILEHIRENKSFTTPLFLRKE
ncbi:MAG: methionine--tRNA ligase [Candidatus Paceibacterota bacterium]